MARRSLITRRLITLAKMLVLVLPISIGFGALLNDGVIDRASVLASIGTAFIIGTPIFAFEALFVTAPWGAAFRRQPLLIFMGGRLLVWAGWIVAGSLIANQTVWITPVAEPLAEPDFWWTIGFSFLISTVATATLTISQLLGPGVLADLMLGRYHSPQTAERAVAFIDLKGSTALAERIGPERFLEAMSRFVTLVSTEIRAVEGRVYDYVGDEVIVVWEGRHTSDLTPAAAALAKLKRRVAAERDSWIAAYGTAPDFRASLHVGPVVAGEIGDDKRAIVLLGDTMNVGARLEQAARDLGHDLVASPVAARRIGPILGMELQPLAPTILRGRTEPTVVVALKI